METSEIISSQQSAKTLEMWKIQFSVWEGLWKTFNRRPAAVWKWANLHEENNSLPENSLFHGDRNMIITSQLL